MKSKKKQRTTPEEEPTRYSDDSDDSEESFDEEDDEEDEDFHEEEEEDDDDDDDDDDDEKEEEAVPEDKNALDYYTDEEEEAAAQEEGDILPEDPEDHSAPPSFHPDPDMFTPGEEVYTSIAGLQLILPKQGGALKDWKRGCSNLNYARLASQRLKEMKTDGYHPNMPVIKEYQSQIRLHFSPKSLGVRTRSSPEAYRTVSRRTKMLFRDAMAYLVEQTEEQHAQKPMAFSNPDCVEDPTFFGLLLRLAELGSHNPQQRDHNTHGTCNITGSLVLAQDQHGDVASFKLDIEGTVVDCNKKACELMGWEREAVIGEEVEEEKKKKFVDHVVAGERKKECEDAVHRAVGGEEVHVMKTPLKSKDGTIVWMNCQYLQRVGPSAEEAMTQMIQHMEKHQLNDSGTFHPFDRIKMVSKNLHAEIQDVLAASEEQHRNLWHIMGTQHANEHDPDRPRRIAMLAWSLVTGIYLMGGGTRFPKMTPRLKKAIQKDKKRPSTRKSVQNMPHIDHHGFVETFSECKNMLELYVMGGPICDKVGKDRVLMHLLPGTVRVAIDEIDSAIRSHLSGVTRHATLNSTQSLSTVYGFTQAEVKRLVDQMWGGDYVRSINGIPISGDKDDITRLIVTEGHNMVVFCHRNCKEYDTWNELTQLLLCNVEDMWKPTQYGPPELLASAATELLLGTMEQLPLKPYSVENGSIKGWYTIGSVIWKEGSRNESGGRGFMPSQTFYKLLRDTMRAPKLAIRKTITDLESRFVHHPTHGDTFLGPEGIIGAVKEGSKGNTTTFLRTCQATYNQLFIHSKMLRGFEPGDTATDIPAVQHCSEFVKKQLTKQKAMLFQEMNAFLARRPTQAEITSFISEKSSKKRKAAPKRRRRTMGGRRMGKRADEDSSSDEGETLDKRAEKLWGR